MVGICEKMTISIWSCVVVCIMGSASLAWAQTKREVTADDFFRLEYVGAIETSPDGIAVAYELKRPKMTSSRFGSLSIVGLDNADIWVAATNGETPKNITNGTADKSGFWGPKWSPDGRCIVMASTRGGKIRLWLWSSVTNRLELLSDAAVNPWDYVWVSDRELAFWIAQDGETGDEGGLRRHTPRH